MPIMNKKGYDDIRATAVLQALKSSNITPCVQCILLLPDADIHDIVFNIRKISEMSQMGFLVAIGDFLIAQLGCPAYDYNEYETTVKFIHNKYTGKCAKIKHLFVPRDEQIRNYVENFNDKIDMYKKSSCYYCSRDKENIDTLLHCAALANILQQNELEQELICRMKVLLA